MIKPYPHHPFADIFPFRDGPSLVELSDNLRENGQHDEIVLLKGQVLEGRRRQVALIRAGIKPRYRDFGSRPGDGKDALKFAFDVNYHRRDDMTKAEKAIAAAKYASLKKGHNPANAGLGEKPGVSQKEAAEKFGISDAAVERAKAVLQKGVPELQEAMRSEDVSISDAAGISGEEPEVQRKAVEKVKAGKAKTLKEAVGKPKTKAGDERPQIVRDLSALIERVGKTETPEEGIRKEAVDMLKKALALVRKL